MNDIDPNEQIACAVIAAICLAGAVLIYLTAWSTS